jgi:hypothetical protein
MTNHHKNHSHHSDRKKISEDTKIYIVEKLIEPSYKSDIASTIHGKKCWKITGMTFETMSKSMVAIGGVMSFSAGYFNSAILSFVAGSISTLSLALLQFSSFSYTQNKKQADELNILLKTLDLETIPSLTRSIDENTQNAKMKSSTGGISNDGYSNSKSAKQVDSHDNNSSDSNTDTADMAETVNMVDNMNKFSILKSNNDNLIKTVLAKEEEITNLKKILADYNDKN